jgi:hypothetical protein
MAVDGAVVNGLVVNGPRPTLRAEDGAVPQEPAEHAFDVWQAAATTLLQLWV